MVEKVSYSKCSNPVSHSMKQLLLIDREIVECFR